MEAFKDAVMPPRFAEYVCAHLLANLPMHADNQVSIVLGGFALLTLAKTDPCLEAVKQALASGLPELQKRDYEMLKAGLENLITAKTG